MRNVRSGRGRYRSFSLGLKYPWCVFFHSIFSISLARCEPPAWVRGRVIAPLLHPRCCIRPLGPPDSSSGSPFPSRNTDVPYVRQVTRGLRARLSYAGYKAKHNIPHVPLRDLEAQSTGPASGPGSRAIGAGAKRKVAGAGNNNYYNNPATQSVHNPPATVIGQQQRGRGSMAPPVLSSSASTASRSNYYPNTTTNATRTSQTPSLYSSILAPPPAKQARTIHNPRDPPIPAPTRPPVTPKPAHRSIHSTGGNTRGKGGEDSNANLGAASGRPRALSLVEGTRSHAKSRSHDFGIGAAGTAGVAATGRKRTTSHKDKGKHKASHSQSLSRTDTQEALGVEVDGDGDVDMKAAATLTSLLLQHHPLHRSGTSVTSPRSSLSNGSDGGSQGSFSLFRQSSARTGAEPAPGTPTNSSTTIATTTATTTTAPSASSSALHSAESSFTTLRSTTPPPHRRAHTHAHNLSQTSTTSSILSASSADITGTPARKGRGPTDSEAADLMLYLATSPSPVRPAHRERGEGPGGGTGGLRVKGRVLFAGTGGDVNMDMDTSPPHSGLSIHSSSAGGRSGAGAGLAAPMMEANVIPPSPMAPTPSQLLPPPPSPSSFHSNSNHNSNSADTTPRPPYHPQPNSQLHSQSQTPNQTPGNTPFNLNDFINVSPSPAHTATATGTPVPGGSGMMMGMGSSLRADVGRRLFEGEQGVRYVGGAGVVRGEGDDDGRSGDGGGLEAGIDML